MGNGGRWGRPGSQEADSSISVCGGGGGGAGAESLEPHLWTAEEGGRMARGTSSLRCWPNRKPQGALGCVGLERNALAMVSLEAAASWALAVPLAGGSQQQWP